MERITCNEAMEIYRDLTALALNGGIDIEPYDPFENECNEDM